MLKSLAIRQFKAFGDTETVVPLESFTLIAGQNGAGKTSILQAIELLGALTRGTLSDALAMRSWDFLDLVHLKAENSIVSFTAVVERAERTFTWELKLSKRRYVGIHAERVVDDSGQVLMERDGATMWRYDELSGEEVDRVRQSLGSSWLDSIAEDDAARFPQLTALAGWARGIRPYVVLDPLKLREPSAGPSDWLGNHGEGLAAVLGALAPEQRGRVLERVKTHYPSLAGVESVGGDDAPAELKLVEAWGSQAPLEFSARQVSDGLLRLLALAAIQELDEPPTLLLIDEIENGVHPRLLRSIVRMLQDLTDSGIQVLATTHSPVALSFVRDAAEVLLVGRNLGDGETRVMPLSDSAKWASLSRAFAPGEAWYALGEDDLFGP